MLKYILIALVLVCTAGVVLLNDVFDKKASVKMVVLEEEAESAKAAPAPVVAQKAEESPASTKNAVSSVAQNEITQDNGAVSTGGIKQREVHAGAKKAVQVQSFDRESYLRDPKAYLKKVDPDRIFDQADPASGASYLTSPQKARFEQVATGKTVALQITAEPGMPVSWDSPYGGAFTESNRNSVTVAADENGLATVHWLATEGTTGDAEVLAASPVHAGQVRFVLEILEKKQVENKTAR